MPFSEIESRMLRIVVGRFMNLRETTNRKDLVSKFKSYEAVDRLISVGALNKLDNDGNLAPLSLGIEYAGNPDFLMRAKTSLEIALQILQNLYDINPPRGRETCSECVWECR
jgi:hypothetical protein